MTFDDKNMIQICSQILEFSDQTLKHFSSASWQIPSTPVFPWSTLEDPFPCLGPVSMSGDVWIWSEHWVDATKSWVEHTYRCFVPFKDVSTLYRLVCLNKKTFGSLGIGGWSLVIAWRLHFPGCFAGDISIKFAELWPKYHHIQRPKNPYKSSIGSFFFQTIYELMIKKKNNSILGQGNPQGHPQLYPLFSSLKTSIFLTLVEPILVAFRPQKKIPVLWRSVWSCRRPNHRPCRHHRIRALGRLPQLLRNPKKWRC